MWHLQRSSLLVCRITHSRQNNHTFNCKYSVLTMLMTSLARDADVLGRIKVEIEVEVEEVWELTTEVERLFHCGIVWVKKSSSGNHCMSGIYNIGHCVMTW